MTYEHDEEFSNPDLIPVTGAWILYKEVGEGYEDVSGLFWTVEDAFDKYEVQQVRTGVESFLYSIMGTLNGVEGVTWAAPAMTYTEMALTVKEDQREEFLTSLPPEKEIPNVTLWLWNPIEYKHDRLVLRFTEFS